jgi:hypothetical protein
MSDNIPDILGHFTLSPLTSSELDGFASLMAIVRGANETDAGLRARINAIMKHQPGPDNTTLHLFLLLEKLDLKSCTEMLNAFMPVGHRWP